MSMSEDSHPPENRLLADLPAEEYQRLLPHLKPVSLSIHQTINAAREPVTQICFPIRAAVSLVSTMEDGSTIEVGLVGQEGMVGIPVILGSNTYPYEAFVQVQGSAMLMSADVLKAEFNLGGQLQTILLRYVQALLVQTSQTAACNRFHTIEERFARWLLLVRDCVQSNEFQLTQEIISQMLGTRRSGVTVAAGTLQQAGMLRYTRGKITIINQEALAAASCECYRVIKDEFTRLLGK